MTQQKNTSANSNTSMKQDPTDTWAIARRGKLYQEQGHYTEALQDFKQVIELNPTDTWAIAHRGEIFRLLKRNQESLNDFNQAIELDPNYAWAIAHRGATYRQMKNYPLALSDFNRAIELDSTYAWAIFYRARIYELMDCWAETLVDLDRAMSLDKSLISHWHSERGVILSYLGRLNEAVAEWQQALQEHPDDHLALYQMAVANVRQNGYAKAREEVDKARTELLSMGNHDSDYMLFYWLGGLAALEGKIEQALSYLAEAIALDDEPILHAFYDPAWQDLRPISHFQSLISEKSDKERSSKDV